MFANMIIPALDKPLDSAERSYNWIQGLKATSVFDVYDDISAGEITNTIEERVAPLGTRELREAHGGLCAGVGQPTNRGFYMDCLVMDLVNASFPMLSP
jgi:hypothetical protein